MEEDIAEDLTGADDKVRMQHLGFVARVKLIVPHLTNAIPLRAADGRSHARFFIFIKKIGFFFIFY